MPGNHTNWPMQLWRGAIVARKPRFVRGSGCKPGSWAAPAQHARERCTGTYTGPASKSAANSSYFDSATWLRATAPIVRASSVPSHYKRMRRGRAVYA